MNLRIRLRLNMVKTTFFILLHDDVASTSFRGS